MNPIRHLASDSGPILRALTRSRAGPLLIALQCAITLAIVANAIFIIQDRLQKMSRPSGMDVDNTFVFFSLPIAADFDGKAVIAEDMRRIRALPGVVDASISTGTPLSGGGSSSSFAPRPEAKPEEYKNAAYYETDDHGLNAFGVTLVAGRNFLPAEVEMRDPLAERGMSSAIITKAFADKLFPPDGGAGAAVGKSVYGTNQKAIPIVGIVERAQTPWLTWGELEHSIFLSSYSPDFPRYVVRTEPGERERLIPEVEKLMAEISRDRIVERLKTQTEIEHKAYGEYRAMAVILTSVIVLIVCITGLGIVGLASFNVNARNKQIGTRRALGATKRDIVRYFLVESWLITTAGAVVGSGLSLGLSFWMVNTFDLPPLDWRYIPVGVGLLWVLGLAAVLVPARRASQLAPALATRSV
ncbi:MAG: FtsX-like permease family protein [Pseudomonadota bacterium]